MRVTASVASASARVGRSWSARVMRCPRAPKLAASVWMSGLVNATLLCPPTSRSIFHSMRPYPVVLPDQHDHRDAFAHRGLDLLGVHQERTVADHGEHFRVGLGELDAERAGQREARGGQ